ncbi:unnamed protein product [Blepharisma stoltei]|uniref:COX assembly mitochondrial protein n=1 Tax=Blepharisma stoltei TaxID=1481888 RepID=A0AAU9JKV5_9CILI|nr:unnamed protein product [Blepharisma stoltei]
MDKEVIEENKETFKNAVCDLKVLQNIYDECLDNPQNYFACLNPKLQVDKCRLLHQSIDKEFTRHELMTYKKWLWQVRQYRKEKRYLKREVF